jgi:serine/threonine-protein kinase
MPFMAETMPQLVALVLEEKAPRMDVLRPDLPESLVEAVARCLEKDREKRFQHIAQLAEAIASMVPKGGLLSAERTSRIVTGSGLDRTTEVPSTDMVASAHDVGVVAPPPKLRATATAFGRTGQGASLSPRRVSPGVWIGALGVLVGAGAVAMLLSSGKDPGQSSAAVSSHATQMLLPQGEPVRTPEIAPGPTSATSANSSASGAATAAPTVTEALPEVVPADTDSAAQAPGKPVPQTPHRAPSRAVEKKPKDRDPFSDRF